MKVIDTCINFDIKTTGIRKFSVKIIRYQVKKCNSHYSSSAITFKLIISAKRPICFSISFFFQPRYSEEFHCPGQEEDFSTNFCTFPLPLFFNLTKEPNTLGYSTDFSTKKILIVVILFRVKHNFC